MDSNAPKKKQTAKCDLSNTFLSLKRTEVQTSAKEVVSWRNLKRTTGSTKRFFIFMKMSCFVCSGNWCMMCLILDLCLALYFRHFVVIPIYCWVIFANSRTLRLLELRKLVPWLMNYARSLSKCKSVFSCKFGKYFSHRGNPTNPQTLMGSVELPRKVPGWMIGPRQVL